MKNADLSRESDYTAAQIENASPEAQRTRESNFTARQRYSATPQAQMGREADYTAGQTWLAGPEAHKIRESMFTESYKRWRDQGPQPSEARYWTAIKQEEVDAAKEAAMSKAYNRGPVSGSMGEGIQTWLNEKLIDPSEKWFSSVSQGQAEKANEYKLMMKGEGQTFGGGPSGLAGFAVVFGGSLTSGFIAGAWDTATFLVRPKLWSATAGTIYGLITNPQKTASEAWESYMSNPGYGGGYLTGSLATGYAMGELGNKLTEKQIKGELPTRTRTLEKALRYENPQKPYGYQWSVKRETLPMVKENFSITDYQVSRSGQGYWPKSGKTGFGKVTGYMETGADLIPLYEQIPAGSELRDFYIPYQKALYSYRPGIRPAGYSSIPYSVTRAGVGLMPGLGLSLGTILASRSELRQAQNELVKFRNVAETTTLTRQDARLRAMQRAISKQATETITIQKHTPIPVLDTPTEERVIAATRTKLKPPIEVTPPRPRPPRPKPPEPKVNKYPLPRFGLTTGVKKGKGKKDRAAWFEKLYPVTSPEEMLGLKIPRLRRRR